MMLHRNACIALLIMLALAVPAHPPVARSAAAHQPPLVKQLVDGQWRTGQPIALHAARGPALAQTSADPEPWLRLVYNTFDGSDWEIRKLLRQDFPGGSSAFAFIHLTENDVDELAPRLSPDSQTIAFYQQGEGDDIYLMDDAGGGRTRITNNPARDILPVWSPDGARLAFASLRDGNWNIYVMNRDGSGQTQLTSDSAADLAPSWSPDGTTIAWMRVGAGSAAIWLMRADGGQQRALTGQLPYLENPSWSPDGSLLAFDYDADGDGLNRAAVINPDGTGLRTIVPNGQFATVYPYDMTVNGWSPDGDRLMVNVVEYNQGSAVNAYVARLRLINGETAILLYEGFEAYADARSTDLAPPESAMDPLASYTRAGPVALSFRGADRGIAGFADFDLQYRLGAGPWTAWKSRQYASTAVYTGTAGASLAFRVRGRDYAGNLEPWRAAGDAATTFYTYNLSGRVTDTRGYPAEASLQLTPAALTRVVLGPQGDYATRLVAGGSQSAAISAPGWAAPPATSLDLSGDRIFRAGLLPSDNLIANSGFERAGLAGWIAGGSPGGARTSPAGLTGVAAAQLGLPCTGDCLSAAERVPADPDGISAQIVVGADGAQHMIYGYNDKPGFGAGGLAYQRRPIGGDWSAPLAIGNADTSLIQISKVLSMVLDPQGTLHAVWLSPEGRLVYRGRSAAGVWSAAQTLDQARAAPQLVLAGDGRLFLIAECDDAQICPPPTRRSALRVLTPGQAWGPLRTFAVGGATGITAPDGRVLVYWQPQGDGIYLGTLSDGGVVSDAYQLAAARDDVVSGYRPAIAVDPYGMVHLIVSQDATHLLYSACAPQETCPPPIRLDGAGGALQLRSDPQGGLHLLITNDSGFGIAGAAYRRRSPGGSWSPQIKLTDLSYELSTMSLDARGGVHLVAGGAYRHTPTASSAASLQISQTVSIPAGMHRPTLAFAATAVGLGDGSSLAVRVRAGGGPATQILTTTANGVWGLSWVDMAAYAGQTVEVRIALDQAAGRSAAQVRLDDVSLGSWQTPVISGYAPAGVSAVAPTTLTIYGDNFFGAPQVRLGTTLLSGVTLVDSQTLRVTVPAGLRAGLTRLIVSSPGGQRSAVSIPVGRQVYVPLVLR